MIRNLITIVIAAAAALLAGCSSPRSLSYFEDIEEYTQGSLGEASDPQLRIEPEDELLITVNSVDPSASADYNLPMANPATNAAAKGTTTPSQQTYTVNARGDINFPVLGTIHVAGMTTLELTDYLTSRISEKVIDPVVRVSLVNFTVNLIGEFGSPRRLTSSKERLTILEAIAAAGDVTDYGKRESILVIREIDGKKVYQRLNLQDSKITESPFYYLKQNDVVYIEPNSIRQANSKYNTNNAYKLTVISSVVSAASVIATLIIAFTK